MIRAALLALLLAGLVAAPAHAGARADAKRLGRVYLAYEREVERNTEAAMSDVVAEAENCPAQPPRPAADEEVSRVISLYIRSFVMIADTELDRLQRRMQGFRTRDRTVRRVARAIAHTTRLVRVLGEAPPRPCPYLEAWKAAGWAEDFRISMPVRNFTPAEVALLRADARTVRRSLRRLRRLGASATAVESLRDSWTGDELYGQLAL